MTLIFSALSSIIVVKLLLTFWGAARNGHDDSGSAPNELPSIAIIKPLCGEIPGLGDNLRSFFEQDYPRDRIRVCFCAESPQDPALPTARAIAAEFPGIRCEFFIGDKPPLANPKIRNIAPACDAATEDWIYVSDANIRIPADFLLRVITRARNENAALVTSWFRQLEPIRGLPAYLERALMSGPYYQGMLLAGIFGKVPASGKTLFLSHEFARKIGGVAVVGNLFVDDVKLSSAVRRAGGKVSDLGPAVWQSSEAQNWKGLWNRHLRWAVGRKWLSPKTFFIEPPLYSLPSALILIGAALGTGVPPPLAWAGSFALIIAADTAAYFSCEPISVGHVLSFLVFWVPSQVFLAALWLGAITRNGIEWRGIRYRLGAGTRLTLLPKTSVQKR